MADTRRFGIGEALLLLLVVAVAAGARIGYLCALADNGNHDGPLRVQDAPADLADLVSHLKEHGAFSCRAPLAEAPEPTVHVAPGYPWLLSLLERSPIELGPVDRTVRWAQCGLGTLSAALYFLFALAAFRSRLAAGLAGLLAAVHPFWIISTATIDDGVLATFLLALALFLGARAGQWGGALTSLLVGLTLAGLALVRAALLPFAFVTVLWFLFRCRSLRGGWLYALVALLGFLIGIAPWTVRNFQLLGDLVPLVDSTYLHLWMGNNPKASGGPQTAQQVLDALAEARGQDAETTAQEMAQIQNQKQRYGQLGPEVMKQVQADPAGALRRRLWAGLYFVFGEHWFKERELAVRLNPDEREMPGWLAGSYDAILQGTLLGMLLLGALGWRWSYAWRREAMPSSLAVVWVPLPYLLSHAAELSGPRLPLDGVLLTYAAFALACLVPGVGGKLRRGEADGPDADDRPAINLR